jgi:hypothetical protein
MFGPGLSEAIVAPLPALTPAPLLTIGDGWIEPLVYWGLGLAAGLLLASIGHVDLSFSRPSIHYREVP